jgi:hypothetical protein
MPEEKTTSCMSRTAKPTIQARKSTPPVEPSWRFGQYRKWHPDHEFLYEVIRDGQRMFESLLYFREDQVVACRPLPQTRKDHPSRTGDCHHKICMERVRAEQRKKQFFLFRLPAWLERSLFRKLRISLRSIWSRYSPLDYVSRFRSTMQRWLRYHQNSGNT